MKVSVGISQKRFNLANVVMEVVYMDENYQEFISSRDFGFESFWSGVGGFVGIFLGHSLLQLPEILDKMSLRYLTRKAVKKKGLLRKRRVQNRKD